MIQWFFARIACFFIGHDTKMRYQPKAFPGHEARGLYRHCRRCEKDFL